MRGRLPIVEAPESAEPDRTFVEDPQEQRLVRLHRQHPNLHKRGAAALRSVPPLSSGAPAQPAPPSASPSPPTEPPPAEAPKEEPMPKAAKKPHYNRWNPHPPETKRKVLAAVDGGMTLGEVKGRFGVGHGAVKRWKKERDAEARSGRRSRRVEPEISTLLSRPEAPKRTLEIVAKELAEATARVETLKAEMRKLLGD